MSQVSLQDFLKDIQTNHKDSLEKARDGVASGAWDGPPLPLNLEYRVTVDNCEYKPSARGAMQLAMTFEIVAPEEHAGRKLQEYYQPDPTNEISQRKLSEVIGSLGPDLSGLGSDWTLLAQRFIGTNGVIALRTWGEENDRYGVRWINSDRGQNLKTNVKPAKAKTNTNALRPNVNINKPQGEPFPPKEQPAEQAAYTPADEIAGPPGGAPAGLPNTPRPAGGPNLPPGLR